MAASWRSPLRSSPSKQLELRAARDRLDALDLRNLAPWKAKYIGVTSARLEDALSSISAALIALQVHTEDAGAADALKATD